MRYDAFVDSIHISELRIATHIGITDAERAHEQTLLVSVSIFLDTTKAGKTDAIEDTIDYAAVANTIGTIGKTERNTIEKFAEDTAQMILGDFGAPSVEVTVSKHVLPDAKNVSVTITRP